MTEFVAAVVRSVSKNKYGILLMLFNSFLMASTQMLFKASATHQSLTLAIIGVLLQLLGTGVLMLAYRFGSFSVLNPIMALSIVLASMGGWYFFAEHISALQMLGLTCVVLGVGIISAGDS